MARNLQLKDWRQPVFCDLYPINWDDISQLNDESSETGSEGNRTGRVLKGAARNECDTRSEQIWAKREEKKSCWPRRGFIYGIRLHKLTIAASAYVGARRDSWTLFPLFCRGTKTSWSWRRPPCSRRRGGASWRWRWRRRWRRSPPRSQLATGGQASDNLLRFSSRRHSLLPQIWQFWWGRWVATWSLLQFP